MISKYYIFEYVNLIALFILLIFIKKIDYKGKFLTLFLFVPLLFESIIVKYLDDIKYKTDFLFAIYSTLCVLFYQVIFLIELRTHQFYKFFVILILIWHSYNLYFFLISVNKSGLTGTNYIVGLTIVIGMFIVFLYKLILHDYLNIPRK